MDIVKRYYLPVLFILFLWIGYSLTLQSYTQPKSASLQLEVAPGDSALELDNHKASASTIAVTPGEHTVTASKQGFGTITRTVSASMSKTAYVGIVLQPNTSTTDNWYTVHATDAILADGIGSHAADYGNKLALQGNAFLKQLPISYGDGQGGIIEIAQGIPAEPNGPPAIYVTGATPTIRQSVLTFIRTRGYDPASMDIVFTDQSNPLDSNSGD
jgi:hypothetical protein